MTFMKMCIFFIALFTITASAQNIGIGNNFVDRKDLFVFGLNHDVKFQPDMFSSLNKDYSEIKETVNSPISSVNKSHVKVYNKIAKKSKGKNSDWGELKNIINELGIDFNFNYTGEVFSNLNGGLKSRTVYLDNFDLTANFDLSKSLKWKGASIFAYILGNQGQIPNKYIGSIQGISNIAAPNAWKLYQFWLQQNLFNSKLSLLVGLFDINSEFDTRESSSLFINPSQGIGVDFSQSGLNGPSIFPTTSLTFRMKFKPIEQVYFQAAILDGVPGELNNPKGTHLILNKNDGLLIVGELGITSNSYFTNNNYFKIFLGSWVYTKKFDLIPNKGIENHTPQKGTSYGVYLSAEKKIFSESNDEEQGLYGFIRIGMANKNVNPIGYYFGFGVTYKGLIPGRDNDELGFAVANAIIGNPHLHEISVNHNPAGYELNFELTYKMEVFKWFVMQPDFQFILNPGGFKNLNNTIMFGTRFYLIL